MKFGLNYSAQAIALYDTGVIAPDVFKCPAWPDLITQAKAHYPLYIHFPLSVGTGIGDAIDGETKQPANWRKFEKLLHDTNTPYINVHLLAGHEILKTTDAIYDAKQTTENLIKDIETVVRHFGKENVIAENTFDLGFGPLHPAHLAETITQVIETTGCGLLFDLSHARIAAMRLGEDYRSYISRLPMHRIKEVHITGIQKVDDYWIQRALDSGISREVLEEYMGPNGIFLPNGMADHLPLSDDDWPIMAWAAGEIRAGRWGNPWVTSLECGGIGPFWEATYTKEEIAEQVPQLQTIFSGIQSGHG